jgi:hypothetical protein
MRIGLIGLGRIGALHAETLSRNDRVDELLLTDVVPGMAEATAARLGARVARTADDLLASGLDGVVIASSTPTHLTLLRAAVAAGVPTFCEKPVADDPYAVGDLLDIVQRSGIAVQIGFPGRSTRRSWPPRLPSTVRRRGGRPLGVELSDAHRDPVGSLFEDTRDRRTLLGHGQQDVAGFSRAMRQVGLAGPWGVEILSTEHRKRPLTDALTPARDSALDVFAQAEGNDA